MAPKAAADADPHELRVRRQEFATALKLATVGVTRTNGGVLRFSLSDGQMTLTGPGAATSIPPNGSWPAAVLADAAMLKRLSTKLPRQDPIILRASEGKLRIGSAGIDAQIADLAPPAVLLSIGRGPAEVVVAIARLGRPAVVASVGQKEVERANQALQASIADSVRQLEPYGVTRAEVQQLVRSAVEREAES